MTPLQLPEEAEPGPAARIGAGSAAGNGAEPTRAELERQLVLATAAARGAYQDTTRLIRLLSVVSQPAAPEELMDQALAALSEVFFAELAVVTHLLGTRLVLAGACGLAEDDPAFHDGWPATGLAAEALRTGVVVTRSGLLDPVDVPSAAARLGIRSAAWVPLTAAGPAAGPADDLLVLLRSSPAAFTPSDVHVLTSVASRLGLAVEERERGVVLEQLARYGHRLARHLDQAPLLDEAVELFRQLTGADQTWVVTVDGEQARLRAHRGLSGPDLAGWPRRLSSVDMQGPSVRHRRQFLAAGGSATAATIATGEPGPLLEVPVRREGALAAVLFAARHGPRPFARDAAETAAIFANYLAVAMVNADLYRTLRTRATHDPLTGLANRALVAQHLDEALARPRDDSARVGLLFCDLDRFKAVNDLYGHEAGDELLQQVAGRLARCVRPADLLARFGGDEFVVVLGGLADLAAVEEVGQRLARELEHPFVVRGQPVPVSASIGGVLGTPGLSTASAMLRDADAAMYVAKEQGLGQVEVFDEAASHRALDRLDLRSELAQALDRGQLHLAYQPIVALDTGAVRAFEALLRWEHPRHGAVSPEVFVPLAEDTGTILPIGAWVLEQSCRQLAAWKRHRWGAGVAVSVNLSAGQLRHASLVEHTVATLRGAGLDPGDLWLEVTEHSYLRHDVTGSAEALRAAGVHFALDDFGTAYSSLSYLRRFPIEMLKIDRSFVDGVTDRETDQSIVRAILAIAGSLRLTAVAEGVETAAQHQMLMSLGCHLGQGHLFSPPLVAEAATTFLRRSRTNARD